MNSIVFEIVRSRQAQLLAEAEREALARQARVGTHAPGAVRRWRTRIGRALIAAGRLMVPQEARAALPTRGLDGC